MKTCTSDSKDLYFKLMLFFWLTFYLSKDPEKKTVFNIENNKTFLKDHLTLKTGVIINYVENSAFHCMNKLLLNI